ncbi:hypothetical protein WJX72_001486 [[Myrmecia] bisecta]|uniref:Uncharacterized protein n=1 Tax=[Myrmecia] bisecta TaxID=41462 RepID=A0AAW1QP24_9CHLO
MGSQDDWEVIWCLAEGWEVLWDRLIHVLPPWAHLKKAKPGVPLCEQVEHADVLIPTTGVVNGDAIRAAPKLKIIVQPASGYNNIAIDVARERGIPVCTSPGVNAASVAEGALMMMLMLARQANKGQHCFREMMIGQPLGTQLRGKTLGIIGTGTIGQSLARYAAALGMEVLGTTSSSSREDLERLLRQSYCVSIHCPLTPATRGLIGEAELAMMPKGALLINFARGEVIDKQALCDAVEADHLGGVGLDVHWVEPADPSEPLYQHPNVVALGHTGVCTHEVIETYANLLTDNIVRMREGRELLHRLV